MQRSRKGSKKLRGNETMLLRKLFSGMVLALFFLLTSCAPKPAVYEGAAIAVWDLDDLSPSSRGRPDLGGLLSGQVIEVLQKKRNITVVERQRLLLALEELHLGTTSIVDETTRLKLGRLVGARMMAFGGYQIIGGQMRLDLRLVEVETGKVLKAVQKTVSATDLKGWLDTAAKAAEELL